MKTLGVQGKIFVPECAAEAKMEAIRKYGGKLELYGDDCVKAETQAKEIAKQTKNTVYISPYNNIEVVNGQSTIG
jgi:threonine dehydratase